MKAKNYILNYEHNYRSVDKTEIILFQFTDTKQNITGTLELAIHHQCSTQIIQLNKNDNGKRLLAQFMLNNERKIHIHQYLIDFNNKFSLSKQELAKKDKNAKLIFHYLMQIPVEMLILDEED